MCGFARTVNVIYHITDAVYDYKTNVGCIIDSLLYNPDTLSGRVFPQSEKFEALIVPILFIDQPSVPYYENKDSDKSNDKSKLQDAFSVINSFMKEMVEDWNQDFQILLIEHADESFWTGDNKLEYFTTKANFDGDNALVPFHVIKKKKYENNNR